MLGEELGLELPVNAEAEGFAVLEGAGPGLGLGLELVFPVGFAEGLAGEGDSAELSLFVFVFVPPVSGSFDFSSLESDDFVSLPKFVHDNR